MDSTPHLPVLLEETISRVLTNLDGIYLDGTVGYGGHSEALLKKLSQNGRLIGIDLDPYALEYTENRLSTHHKSYSLHNRNFREYPHLLQSLDVDKLTGLIFDLGSSSSQFNAGHRGFSFQANAPLDMRFNPNSGITAAEFLNSSSLEQISETIQTYGEERNHRKISRVIAQSVKSKQMNTTFDLKLAVSKCVHPRFLTNSLARVFQAIRIRINDELESLKEALQNSLHFLGRGGRIAVISFHSLEDRIVKQFFKNCSLTCTCPPDYPICQCSTIPSLKVLTRKAVVPNRSEVTDNPRSRSAKLRVAEKI